MPSCNENLAHNICNRLNYLLLDAGIRKALQDLINTRIPVDEVVADHPTINCVQNSYSCTLGLLGILNGIIGRKHLLTATFDETTKELLGFDIVDRGTDQFPQRNYFTNNKNNRRSHGRNSQNLRCTRRSWIRLCHSCSHRTGD